MNDEFKRLTDSLQGGIRLPSSLTDLMKPPVVGGINPDVFENIVSQEELNDRLVKRMEALEQAVERGPHREWWEHPIVLMLLSGLTAAILTKLIA